MYRSRRRSTGWIEPLEPRRLLSSISGSVFSDANGDGIRQPGEPNLPQQHVWLDFNSDGRWEPNEPTVATDADGNYSFDGLADGSYRVAYYAPPGFHQTFPAAGAAQTVSLTGAASSVDFGVSSGVANNAITGVVFSDLNENGVIDPGEAPLAVQHAWLDLNGDGLWEPSEPTATTDANGQFSFSGIANGTYSVCCYTPPGSQQTSPLGDAALQATVNGSVAANVNFGLGSAATSPLHILFNTSLDQSGFFARYPAALDRLNEAAAAFAGFGDRLAAIVPRSGNAWTEVFSNPGRTNGPTVRLRNQTVPADTLIVYVGARRNVSSSELGFGGPGGWSASGSTSWLNTVAARGQTGALARRATDTGPWGGAISFSSTANWNFSSAPPSPGQEDFLTVATHELGHVLGIGTSAAWTTLLSNGKFTGAAARAANGGSPPSISADHAHFAEDTLSIANGAQQPVVMEPALASGTRDIFTTLDFAALQDIGWQVPASRLAGNLA